MLFRSTKIGNTYTFFNKTVPVSVLSYTGNGTSYITGSAPNHQLVNNEIIYISGATGAQANLNGSWPVVNTGVNSIMFSISPKTVVAGTNTTAIGATTKYPNVNSSLANTFTFTAFSTYPIASVIVNNGGGGFKSIPAIIPDSLYDTTDPEPVDSLKKKGKLASLGILGPIEIVTQGTGYANGDTIIVSNSNGGVGASAYVNVNATGSIITTTYTYSNTTSNLTRYPKGGLGYRNDNLPTLRVSSSGGANAVLQVNQVLGAGADLVAVPDERGIGAITSFVIENYGEDYIAAPSVSLKVRDLVVANLIQAELQIGRAHV